MTSDHPWCSGGFHGRRGTRGWIDRVAAGRGQAPPGLSCAVVSGQPGVPKAGLLHCRDVGVGRQGGACGRWGRGWEAKQPAMGRGAARCPESPSPPRPLHPGSPIPVSLRCLCALQPFPQSGALPSRQPLFTKNPRVTRRMKLSGTRRNRTKGKMGHSVSGGHPWGRAALRLGEHPQVRSRGVEMACPPHWPRVGQQGSGPLCHSLEPTFRLLPTRAGGGGRACPGAPLQAAGGGSGCRAHSPQGPPGCGSRVRH